MSLPTLRSPSSPNLKPSSLEPDEDNFPNQYSEKFSEHYGLEQDMKGDFMLGGRKSSAGKKGRRRDDSGDANNEGDGQPGMPGEEEDGAKTVSPFAPSLLRQSTSASEIVDMSTTDLYSPPTNDRMLTPPTSPGAFAGGNPNKKGSKKRDKERAMQLMSSRKEKVESFEEVDGGAVDILSRGLGDRPTERRFGHHDDDSGALLSTPPSPISLCHSGTSEGGDQNSDIFLAGSAGGNATTSLILDATLFPPSLSANTIANLTTCFYKTSESVKQKLILESFDLTPVTIPTSLITKTFGPSLHKLSLRNNPIKSIPKDLLNDLPQLQTLDLSSCMIRSIDQTWHLPNLRSLDLRNNSIGLLPLHFLAGVPNLRSLNLYNNELTDDACDFSGYARGGDDGFGMFCEFLESIDLGYNQLSTCPPGLAQLPALKTLTLSNNNIQTIPPQIVLMSSLKTLTIKNNPISEPPLETSERGLSHMRGYYQYVLNAHKGSKAAKLLGVEKIFLQGTGLVAAIEDENQDAGKILTGPTSKKEKRKMKKSIGITSKLQPYSTPPAAARRSVSESAATSRSPTASWAAGHRATDVAGTDLASNTAGNDGDDSDDGDEDTITCGFEETAFEEPDSALERDRYKPDQVEEDAPAGSKASQVRRSGISFAMKAAPQAPAVAPEEPSVALPQPVSRKSVSAAPQAVGQIQYDSFVHFPRAEVLVQPQSNEVSEVATANTSGPNSPRFPRETGQAAPDATALAAFPKMPPQASAAFGAGASLTQPKPRLSATRSEPYLPPSPSGGGVSSPSPPPEPHVNNTLKVIFVGDGNAGKTSVITKLKWGNKSGLVKPHKGVIMRRSADGKFYQIKFKKDPDPDKMTPVSCIFVNDEVDKTKIPVGTEVAARRDVIPEDDERTVGVEICKWLPDSQKDLPENEKVEFSMWDFAGQTAYHATHELYYSSQAFYVLCWDMGHINQELMLPLGSETASPLAGSTASNAASFDMDSDSDSSSEEDEFALVSDAATDEELRLKREEDLINLRKDSIAKVKDDVDKKVQFWIDCIQASAPGAVILPIATHDDSFDRLNDDGKEARRRCNIMKERILEVEKSRVDELKKKLDDMQRKGLDKMAKFQYLMDLLNQRPRLAVWGDDPIIRVSSTRSKVKSTNENAYLGDDSNNGLSMLEDRLLYLSKANKPGTNNKLFVKMHQTLSDEWFRLKTLIKELRFQNPFIRFDRFMALAEEKQDIRMPPGIMASALEVFSNVGEILFFNDRYSDLSDSENASTETGRDLRSAFVFLNPKWLMLACKSIMRHDLQNALRKLNLGEDKKRGLYFDNGCPVVSKDEVLELWNKAESHDGDRNNVFLTSTKKCLNMLKEEGAANENCDGSPFLFLTKLLVNFNVFVPVDLSGSSEVVLGGERIRLVSENPASESSGSNGGDESSSPSMFFLPSLLNSTQPPEGSRLFEIRCEEDWQVTLSQSFVIENFQPMGMMHRIIASILREVNTKPTYPSDNFELGGVMEVRLVSVDCYTTQVRLRFNTVARGIYNRDGNEASFASVEVFVALYDYTTVHIGGEGTPDGGYRLVMCGKGARGNDFASKVWLGGYNLVLKATGSVVKEYSGLSYRSEVFCPRCDGPLSSCKSFSKSDLRRKLNEGEETVVCNVCHNNVDMRMLLRKAHPVIQKRHEQMNLEEKNKYNLSMTELHGVIGNKQVDVGVVFVWAMRKWDDPTGGEDALGSGFVVDAAKGLVVTAAHVVFDRETRKLLSGDGGEIIVGVINSSRKAVFKYRARVVESDVGENASDPFLDVCVLEITDRLVSDQYKEHFKNGFGSFGHVKKFAGYAPIVGDELKDEIVELSLNEHPNPVSTYSHVRMLGFPQVSDTEVNCYLTNVIGTVNQIVGDNKELRLRIENYGGFSGGPILLRENNTVVGVLSKGENDFTTAHAVNVCQWAQMVKKARVPKKSVFELLAECNEAAERAARVKKI
jgi:Leucine-rich repeat (LRR) protein/GTPase SAR1 family protein